MPRNFSVETPEAKAARIAKIKATWARKKAEAQEAKAQSATPNGIEPAIVSVGPATGIIETGTERLHYRERAPSNLLQLVTTATTALAQVDSISVQAIEEALPSVTECARVKLALEHLVEKAERMLSLVAHCKGLLVSHLDRIESHE